MAARVEQARGFNTGLVLAPQVVAGMGDETEAARIIGSVESVICHRVNTPEAIIALAGTRQGMEYSTQFASDGATGAGSARAQHQFKVDPNKVRGLDPGMAFLISRGRAMKIQVPRAPTRPRAAARDRLPSARTADTRAGARSGQAGVAQRKNFRGGCPVGGWCVGKGSRDAPILNNQGVISDA